MCVWVSGFIRMYGFVRAESGAVDVIDECGYYWLGAVLVLDNILLIVL